MDARPQKDGKQHGVSNIAHHACDSELARKKEQQSHTPPIEGDVFEKRRRAPVQSHRGKRRMERIHHQTHPHQRGGRVQTRPGRAAEPRAPNIHPRRTQEGQKVENQKQTKAKENNKISGQEDVSFLYKRLCLGCLVCATFLSRLWSGFGPRPRALK